MASLPARASSLRGSQAISAVAAIRTPLLCMRCALEVYGGYGVRVESVVVTWIARVKHEYRTDEGDSARCARHCPAAQPAWCGFARVLSK